VATPQRQQQQHQQHQHQAHVPADAAVVEDAEIVPEVEPQEEDGVAMCPSQPRSDEGEGEAVVRIDETKLGARLLVAGREKGLDAWKTVAGTVGAWAQKAAPPASDAECDWSWCVRGG
jgi:hypothetical protein